MQWIFYDTFHGKYKFLLFHGKIPNQEQLTIVYIFVMLEETVSESVFGLEELS